MRKRELRKMSFALLAALLLFSCFPALGGGEVRTAYAAGAGSFEEVAPSVTDGVYVRIKNDYTGHYLIALDGKASYGEAVETDRASHWRLEPSAVGVRIQNRLTGTYASANVPPKGHWWSDVLLADAGETNADDLAWEIVNAVTSDGPATDRWNIRKPANPTYILHLEDDTGSGQLGALNPAWGSGHWRIEPVVDYVRFQNKHTGQFLTAADGFVSYGDAVEEDPSSHWRVEAAGNGYLIRNRSTGAYVSMLGWADYTSRIPLAGAAEAAAWRFAAGTEAGHWVIQYADNAALSLHIQDDAGYAQVSDLPQNWGTPQWAVVPATATKPYDPEPDTGPRYVRIMNDWLGLYMYEADGKLLYGNAPADDEASHWEIVEEDGVQRIRNRATGHFVSRTGVASDKAAVTVVAAGESAETEQWVIENLRTAGTKLIRAEADEGVYLHLENKLGFVQYGAIPKEWGSPKWAFKPVTESGPRYVRLKNVYRGEYLYETEGKVAYGSPAVEAAESHWLIEDDGGGQARIRNRATGHYMNVEGMQSGENPHLQPLRSTSVEPSWTSAKWNVTETAAGEFVFENVWQAGQRIHAEDGTGYAQSGAIPAEWGSARWLPEDAPAQLPLELPDGFVRLRNADTGAYLYENENGVALYGTLEEGDARSHWTFAGEGPARLINRATGHELTVVDGVPYLTAAPGPAEGAAGLWHAEPAPGGVNVLLRSAMRPLEYAHTIDRAGYVQLDLRSVEALGAQWAIEPAPDEAFVPEPAGSRPDVLAHRLDDTRRVRIVNAADGTPLRDEQGADVWRLQDENGYKLIRSAASGRYLTVVDGKLATAELGTSAPAEAPMQWRIVERGDRLALENGAGASPTDSQAYRFAPLKEDAAFQAEDAFLSGASAVAVAGIAADVPGYEGEGFASLDGAEAEATFAVHADEAGLYKAEIRYANGADGVRALAVAANGLPAGRLQAAARDGGSDWRTAEIELNLRAGYNSVTLSAPDGRVLVDRLTVRDVVPPAYRGASVSYATHEAEHAATNGQLLGPSRAYREHASEASGRQAVRLDRAGDYVEFTLSKRANRLTLRYSVPDSADGSGAETPIGLYVDGKKLDGARLTSRYAWVYGAYPWTNRPEDGSAHRFFDETSFEIGPADAGSTVRIAFDADTTAEYVVVDLLEGDWAEEPYAQPADFVSVTDYGAVADDGLDDTSAIEEAIADAKRQGKGVWLPPGDFRVGEGPIEVADVTIRGAGKWHTTLVGGGFMGAGNRIRVYDLAIDGEVTARRDELPESGFDGAFGTGSTLQHVRIEHVKTGIWSTTRTLPDGQALATDGLYVAGVQVHNTFADGLNFSTGTNRSMAEHNQFRNTGDDGMAMWASGAQSEGNTFRFNTVELPWLASNISVYGGKNATVADNVVSDTVAFGAGISVSTRHAPVPFEGTIEVARNTLLRTGGREHNWPADFGGLLLFADSGREMTGDIRIRDNLIADSSYQGISFLGEAPARGIELHGNVVDGAGTWGIHAAGNIGGEATFGNTIVRKATVGPFMDGAGGFEVRTVDEGFSFEEPPFRASIGGREAAPFVVETGETVQVSVAGDEAGEAVWSSSDDTVVRIADGKLTALKTGTANVAVSWGGRERIFRVAAKDTTAPAWSGGAGATAVREADGTYTVRWPAASDAGGIAGYRLSWGAGPVRTDATATEWNVGALPYGGAIRIWSQDAAGLWTPAALTVAVPGPSDGIGGAVVPQPQPQPPSPPNALEVASVPKTDANGNVYDEAVVDGKALIAALEGLEALEGARPALTLNVSGTARTAVVALPLDALRSAAPVNAVLDVRLNAVPGLAFSLPVDAIAGSSPAPEGAELRIRLGKANGSAAFEPGSAVRSDAYEVGVSVATGGGRTAEGLTGRTFATLEFPANGTVTLATAGGMAYDEASGKWRPVPATFRTLEDGTVVTVVRTVASGTFVVIDEPRAFADVQGHWARDAVSALASRRILNGREADRFAPGDPVTRAEFAAMLTAAFGLPAGSGTPGRFADVPANAWFAGAAEAAAAAGLANGFADGVFHPHERITREQTVALLMRAWRLALPGGAAEAADLGGFADGALVAEWARADFGEAVALGLLQGRPDGRLAPQGEATRAEAAQLVYRLLAQLNWIRS
ncbi:RICIN domain-containing protein [Cohnella algarum]|uniref:RICIN domain-containing protein n=1 Tax=Cohnella algarum TaxID=2044859 RepID=UPI00196816A3|nr:RICIN domain-containing protein [Cohnella algarum]